MLNVTVIIFPTLQGGNKMNNNDLPLVSVITPSYNQAPFIKETIESVLTQDYPNIEYIVIDGGSDDGTLDILRSYRKVDSRFNFVSEPDRGQAHAINKGLQMAKGEVIGWLNSDDTYLSRAISRAVEALITNGQWGMVYGRAYATNKENKVLHPYPVETFHKNRLFERCIICQPAAFIRKSVIKQVGGIDEDFFFCMDYELWMRISKEYNIGYIGTYLANSRCHELSKTALYWEEIGLKECLEASLKHYGTISNTMIYTFVKTHYQKGREWILTELKKFQIFEDTPRVLKTNCYDDSWSPPSLEFNVEIKPNEPLSCLLIKGVRIQPDIKHAHVFLQGELIEEYCINENSFTLEITFPPQESDCKVEIVIDKPLVPAKLNKDTNDERMLGFLVDNIIPLSVKEQELNVILTEGCSHVARWLKVNRKITLFN